MTLWIWVVCVLWVTSVSGWVYNSNITNALRTALPNNLSNFTLIPYSSLQLIIIYGGANSTYVSDRTFILNLTNNQIHEVTSSIRPSKRSSPCNFAANNSVFIVGGKSTSKTKNTVDTSFWKLDLNTELWSAVISNLQTYQLCQMFAGGDTELVIAGASSDGILDVWTYSYSTSQLISRSISFLAYASIEAKQWDGTVITNQIDIDQAPSNSTGYVSINYFPTKGISILKFMSTDDPNNYIMKIDYSLYSFKWNSSQPIYYITFLQSLPSPYAAGTTKFVFSKGWNIFYTYASLTNYYMAFNSADLISVQRIDINSTNFYSETWPNFQNSSSTFSFLIYQMSLLQDPDILLVVHGTLLVYTLAYNVFSNTNTTNYAISNTFYGINQCKPGWTGQNCSMLVCPGSLNLNGANKVSFINFQCSGHGKCTDTGCVCNQLWGGDACNVYLRKKCSGTLLDNFPMNNCECFNTTIGSNSCDVIFCPSDCSNHGTCNQGYCECDNDYYGADCSIMIVELP